MNLLLRLYYSIPNFQNQSVLGKILNRGMEKILKTWFDFYCPIFFKFTSKNTQYTLQTNTFEKKPSDLIIASLTSFPARIEYTYLSVECILRQSYQPDKLILWLAKEQFPEGLASLPKKLLDQTKRGLEIRFCDDLRSHKKYYYSLIEFPQSKVIMFDDDLYYYKDMIKDLMTLHLKYPNKVIASRAHLINFKEGSILPYLQWTHNYNEEKPSVYLHHTSGNGTLLPGKNIFDQTVFDKDLIFKLSPNSDDVWLKMNLIRLQVEVVTNDKYNKDPISVKSTHKVSLVSSNSFKGGKDKQIKDCIDYFDLKFN